MLLLALALVAFVVFACVVIATAIVMGGPTERRAGFGCGVAIVATQIASLAGPHWHGPELGVMVVDFLFAAWLAALACRSSEWWPIWAAGAQLNGAITHIAPIVIPRITDTLYLTIQPLWGGVVLALVLWGSLTKRTPDAE